MRKRLIQLIISTSGIIILIFVISRMVFAKPHYDIYHVKNRTIAETVTASGEMQSNDEVTLTFPVSGKIATLAVKKDDQVHQGSYIGSLDKAILEKQMKQSLLDYSLQRESFDQTIASNNNISDPNSALNDTMKRLLQSNQYNLDSSILNVQIADLTEKNADLYSPIDGVVTDVLSKQGASVVAGTTPVVTIANPNDIEFEAQVGQSDIANVSEGQEATISLDAFPQDTFHGEVTQVDSAATSTTTNGEVYEVKIQINDPKNFKINMTGDTTITTQKHSDALIIPASALIVKGNNYSVKTYNGQKTQEKTVTIGLRDVNGMVEILSGLSQGDNVILNNN